MIIEMPVRTGSDAAQREQALDPTRSFIVEAPAGSGKTGLLVQRYLRLLGTVQKPESVVAMTFTRKAAAEMKERILQALEEATSKKKPQSPFEERTAELAREALANDKRRGWRILSDTSRLQILTIDALCAALTRQMPLLSNFGGSPSIEEGPTELYRLAARRMLRLISETPETQPLFGRVALHFENDLACLERQVAMMIEKRDQWQTLVDGEHDSQLVADFKRLVAVAALELREVFREKSEVDFTEITQAATDALGTPEAPTDLLYALDYRIEHLLVDEFQDTSRAQYRLLKALTEQWSAGDGHTLFLVGDPMQSIYGFREADVGLFLECWQDQSLNAIALTQVRLTRNFRSAPELVDWIQDALAASMAEDNRLEGAVSLRRSEAARDAGGKAPTLHAFIEDKDSVVQAAEIVETVCSLFKKNDSIAILVRSRSHIREVLPLLRAAGIPYEAIEIDNLASEQHVLDVLSITRALVHVGDRVAWLACLRAPWCGIGLSDLATLAEREENRTILELISDPQKISSLSVEGRYRVLKVQEILSAAVEGAGRRRLRKLVEDTWIKLGGPAVLPETRQREDVEAFLDVVEHFEEGGVIRDFSLLDARLTTLFAKPLTEGKRIQVLTIHKAKGLEFDVVLLPRLESHVRKEEDELLIWNETDQGTDVAALPQSGESDEAYQRVKENLKKRRDHENVRLLYVAMTRARNELHLFGCVETRQKKGKSKDREISPAHKGSHLYYIWPTVRPRFEEVFHHRKLRQANMGFAAPTMNSLLRLPAGWQETQRDASVRWQPGLTRTTASTSKKRTYEWVSDTGRHVGTVVHQFLKRIGVEGLRLWPIDRLDSVRQLIASELRRLGVVSSELEEATALVVHALTNTLTSDRGQWMLGDRDEAKSEWPIAGRVGDRLVTGTIDRTFRNEGRLWIVDFKTSQHQGAARERFLEEEQRRYRDQLESYAVLISRMSAGPISLGLYFPLLDAWREWSFEQAEERAPA